MTLITSSANEKIKYAKAVRDDAAVRRRDAVCFAEGLRLCGEALAANIVQSCFVTEDFSAAEPDFVQSAAQKGVELYTVSDAAARALADTRNPQGVFCVCGVAALKRDAAALQPQNGFLCMDRVSDPGNMGTILRTAEAFGADTLLVGEGCCDVFAPKVLRASMGAGFRVKAYFAENLASEIVRLSGKGVTFYAAMLDHSACDLRSLRADGPFAVIIGNEANGVRPEVAAHCKSVFIPMSGGAESLNAASAAAIFLWELFGRR